MPLISIIIPYASKHATAVRQAVASCIYQSFTDWEAIVVNDSAGADIQFVDKRVKTINSYNNVAPNRAAAARNKGLAHAQGLFVVFLDADDYLLPKALELLLRGHITHDKTYTYSSHYNGPHHMRPPAYEQEKYRDFNIHPITCLIPTNAVRAVGGFDEQAPGWEDWTLYLRLAIAGYCGEFVRGPIFVYRDDLSILHIKDAAGGKELMERVIAPYKKNGRIDMAKCCGGGPDKITTQRVVGSLGGIDYADAGPGMVVLEYYGEMKGASTWRHPVSGRTYRAGRNNALSSILVPIEDVDWLLQFKFRRVMPTQPLTPPPVEAEVVVIEAPVEPVNVVEAPQDLTASATIDATALEASITEKKRAKR